MTVSKFIADNSARALEFLLSEAGFHRSRDNLTFSGKDFVAGEVFGISTATAVVTSTAAAGNVGNGVLTLAGTPYSADAKVGNYSVVAIEPAADGGSFVVEDPDGVVVGTAKVGVAFNGDVKFTIADGATDFAAGDRFILNVVRNAGKAITYAAGKDPGGIAGYNYSAADADVDGMGVTRDAEVKGVELVWPEGISAGDKANAIKKLAKNGIIVR